MMWYIDKVREMKEGHLLWLDHIDWESIERLLWKDKIMHGFVNSVKEFGHWFKSTEEPSKEFKWERDKINF